MNFPKIGSAVRLLSLCSVYLLFGCSPQRLFESFTTPEQIAAAKSDVELLRDRRFQEIEKQMETDLVDDGLEGTLSQMADMIPVGEPRSVKVVGAHILKQPESTRYDVTLEYEFPERWLLVEVATGTRGRQGVISSFRVQPMQDSLEHVNRFRLSGLGTPQWVVLSVGLLSLGCSLDAFVLCLRSRIRKKWLWAVIALVGIGRLGVNWTTGNLFSNLIWVDLPTTGAFSQLYGPWMVYASLPAGAILFLFLRRSLERDAYQASAPPPIEA